MGMHISGVVEYRDEDGWQYLDDLPFIVRPSLYYHLFGQHNEIKDVTPVAPERGLPEDMSEKARSVYDRQTLDREVHLSWGESWLTLDEFPEDQRGKYKGTDADWGTVFEMIAPYEADYGSENIRFTVWFDG